MYALIHVWRGSQNQNLDLVVTSHEEHSTWMQPCCLLSLMSLFANPTHLVQLRVQHSYLQAHVLCLLTLQRQECNFRAFIFFIGLVVVTYSITLCCGSTRFGLSHICLNPSTLRHFSGAHRPPIKIFSKDNSRYCFTLL